MESPLLILHGEQDEVIPFSHGLRIYEARPATDRTHHPIPEARHNDFFPVAGDEIIGKIAGFATRVAARSEPEEMTTGFPGFPH